MFSSSIFRSKQDIPRKLGAADKQALRGILPGEISRSIRVYLPSASHETLARLLEYVQDQIHGKISIASLARPAGFSVRTLARLFAQQLGVSFSGYCKIARTMKALGLIETGSDNDSQIAGRVD